MKKKFISLFTMLCIVLSVIPVVSVSADGDFTGSGTQINPYVINTSEDFAKLAEKVNGGQSYENMYFKLTADNLTVSEPIGNEGAAFKGTFDGQNHTVNLDFSKTSRSSYIGLFGYNEGVIKNVKTAGDVNVDRKNNVGSIAAYSSGTIMNCSNSASVTGAWYVGGIVGDAVGSGNEKSVVSACINTGAVNGMMYVGAMVGLAERSRMNDCYNDADIMCSGNYVGGICGVLSLYGGEFYNCVNNGAVKVTEESTVRCGAIVSSVPNDCLYNCFFADELNKGLNDYGTCTSTGETKRECAVSSSEMLSKKFIQKLNLYNKSNDVGIYWVADGGNVSFTEIQPELPSRINNNSTDFLETEEFAEKGDVVSVKAKANDYGTIVGISVTDKNGNSVDVTGCDGVWNFVMPAGEVVVKADLKYKELEKDGDTYLIKSAADYVIFSVMVNNGQNELDARVEPGEEIDLTGKNATIGNENCSYKGNFDGNGAVLKVNSLPFYSIENATVKNIDLVVNMGENIYAGLAYKSLNSTIANCRILGGSFENHKIGGFVFSAEKTLIINCVLDSVTANNAAEYGGIVYETGDKTEIINCVNYDTPETVSRCGMIACVTAGNIKIENNFFVVINSIPVYEFFSYNGAVVSEYVNDDAKLDNDRVQNYYVEACQNDYIRKNPNAANGTELTLWSKNGKADKDNPPLYKISWDGIKIKNMPLGEVKGETVSFVKIIGAEYSVKKENGEVIEISEKDGVCSFVMPDSNVEIKISIDIGTDETKVIDGKTYVVIKTASELAATLRSIENGNNILNVFIANDITVGEEYLYGFSVSDNSEYNGIFDGNGKTITFEEMNAQISSMIGVIGKNGVIKNLTVAGTFSGLNSAEPFAALNSGKIINCINEASVISLGTASGFVGVNTDSGYIVNCVNAGNINGRERSNAIATYNIGTIFVVANSGSVSGNYSQNLFIGSGPSDAIIYGMIDLSEDVNSDGLAERYAAYANEQIEVHKLIAPLSYMYPDRLRDAVAQMKPYSAKNNKIIFASEENLPYFGVEDIDGNDAKKVGETVKITVPDEYLTDGYTAKDIVKVTKKNYGDVLDLKVIDDKTVSFEMPENTCYVTFLIFPKNVEKDADGFYLVNSAESLDEISKSVTAGNTDINVRLTADITGVTEPIGGYYKYNGIFDGNSHSITIDFDLQEGDEEYSYCYGLFRQTDRGAIIKNLTINGSMNLDTYIKAGVFVGKNEGSIINCINNAQITGNSADVGGFVGENIAQPKMPLYISTLSLSEDKEYSGLIKNCTNNAALSGSTVGAITNEMYNNNNKLYSTDKPAIIENCTNNGTLTAEYSIGGIANYAYSTDYELKVCFINCVNNGNITTLNPENEDSYIGGIISDVNCAVIDGCVNNGSLSGGYVGGIANSSYDTVIKNCENRAEISALKKSGGILSYAADKIEVTNCINFGKITALGAEDDSSAGIIGCSYSDCKIAVSNCLNSGEISAVNAYALVGEIADEYNEGIKNAQVKNSYYTNASLESSNIPKSYDKSSRVTDLQIKSGEVSYMLNGGVESGLKKWSVGADGAIFADDENGAVYKVTIGEAISGGSVATDKVYAKAGSKVTITAKPDSGFKLSGISGANVAADGTFVMPENDVTISAVFKADNGAYIKIVGEMNDKGEYTVEYNAKSADFVLAIADYDEKDNLENVQVLDTSSESGTLFIKKGENKKLMLWRSLSDMTPICESLTIK